MAQSAANEGGEGEPTLFRCSRETLLRRLQELRRRLVSRLHPWLDRAERETQRRNRRLEQHIAPDAVDGCISE